MPKRQRRQSSHVYKVRRMTSHTRHKDQVYDVDHFSIGIPKEVGELIAARLFRFELTEIGFQYVPVDPTQVAVKSPQWLEGLKTGEVAG